MKKQNTLTINDVDQDELISALRIISHSRCVSNEIFCKEAFKILYKEALLENNLYIFIFYIFCTVGRTPKNNFYYLVTPFRLKNTIRLRFRFRIGRTSSAKLLVGKPKIAKRLGGEENLDQNITKLINAAQLHPEMFIGLEKDLRETRFYIRTVKPR